MAEALIAKAEELKQKIDSKAFSLKVNEDEVEELTRRLAKLEIEASTYKFELNAAKEELNAANDEKRSLKFFAERKEEEMRAKESLICRLEVSQERARNVLQQDDTYIEVQEEDAHIPARSDVAAPISKRMVSHNNQLASSSTGVPSAQFVPTMPLPMPPKFQQGMSVTAPASYIATYGVKMPTFKANGDIESFLDRFEQFCTTQHVDVSSKANLLLSALDEATFIVVKRELNDNERQNYDMLKRHLLARFDIFKEAGQKRLIFRQAKREVSQSFEEFYTHLLGLAAKAFHGESSNMIDKILTDHFIIGCNDDKVRLYLIEKAPKSSKETLSTAVAYTAALKYNYNLKENSLPVDPIGNKNYSGISKRNQYNFRRNYRFNYRPIRGRFNAAHRNGYSDNYSQASPGYGRGIGHGRVMPRGNHGHSRGRGRGHSGIGQEQTTRSQNTFTSNALEAFYPYYVNGIINNVELPMLIDTGSAVTIMHEEVWKIVNTYKQKLEKIQLSLKSATQHMLEVVGQAKMPIRIPSKRRGGIAYYYFTILVAIGLSHKLIIGMDFFRKFDASINIPDRTMTFFNESTKCVHNLQQKDISTRSISVVIEGETEVTAFSEKRLECRLAESIENGKVVYLHPAESICAIPEISVAGSIDVVRDGKVTVQVINPSTSTIKLKTGEILGQVEVVCDAIKESHEIKTYANKEKNWFKAIDIGDVNSKQNEKESIQKLLLSFQDVFSKHENDYGRCGIIQHRIEIL